MVVEAPDDKEDSMNLGTQYYRPPFPDSRYWEKDLRAMRAAGLDTVQLWMIWAWVEPVPGRFCFDDYDRLVELSGKAGLNLVLSTIAEIQPYWIHREEPGSEMITNAGHKVVSSNRSECHFGITPGGCTDHPGVWERMAGFLSETAIRYRTIAHLRGWDAWNELRWNINADGPVCYCPHTLKAFRTWLEEKYGSLDGLNRSWKRRYGGWDEVLPGKTTHGPYTEMMAFQNFLTARASRHAAARYRVIKGIDPDHAVTVHGDRPSPLYFGGGHETALNRGNDWEFVDVLDGVGCSSFPKWFRMDDADFGVRVECVKSAAGKKEVWLSEVQGGRAATGFDVHEPVDAASQQRWIWNGVACGADMILLWCWRDEVFGRESGGFGITGLDGLAGQRVEAMRRTGMILKKRRKDLAAYEPAEPEVGVLFSPQSYYLNSAAEGEAKRAGSAFMGYCKALVRNSVPFLAVEENHLDCIDSIKVLFAPRTVVTDGVLEARLADWVRRGGCLVCESEFGAFSPQGFYRYPEDRMLARVAGIREVGRRRPADAYMGMEIDGEVETLDISQWLTPMRVSMRRGVRIFRGDANNALAAEVPLGKGRIMAIGAYPGDAYMRKRGTGFEKFVRWVANRGGVEIDLEAVTSGGGGSDPVYIKHGTSMGRRVIFVFFPQGSLNVVLRARKGFLRSGRLAEWISGQRIDVEQKKDGTGWFSVGRPEDGVAVLVER